MWIEICHCKIQPDWFSLVSLLSFSCLLLIRKFTSSIPRVSMVLCLSTRGTVILICLRGDELSLLVVCAFSAIFGAFQFRTEIGLIVPFCVDSGGLTLDILWLLRVGEEHLWVPHSPCTGEGLGCFPNWLAFSSFSSEKRMYSFEKSNLFNLILLFCIL